MILGQNAPSQKTLSDITIVTCVQFNQHYYVYSGQTSPYLKHLVFLDVQKCTKYVKSRGSYNTFCRYPFVKINTVFRKWNDHTIDLSSRHICAREGGGKESTKGSKCGLGEVWLTTVPYVCILFYFPVYIFVYKGQKSPNLHLVFLDVKEVASV